MTPLISIVVPVFNVEPFLAACLDALRAQSLAAIEIICVDDASTDGSPGILASAAAADSRIKIIRHCANNGLSAARNTGVRAASAPWVLFVDSDDLVSSRICERSLAAAQQTGADVVFFAHTTFEDGAPPPAEPPPAKPALADRARLLRRPAFAWTKLASTNLMRSRKIEFPEGLCFEDVPVHWRLALESASPALLDEALVWYRQRRGSITYRTDWSRADGIVIYDLIRDYLRSTGRWAEWKDLFLVRQLANFAHTHAYYALANPMLKERVRQAARARMTPEHWSFVLNEKGLSRWERDYLIACGQPNRVRTDLALLLPILRHRLRDPLRCLWHRFRLERIVMT